MERHTECGACRQHLVGRPEGVGPARRAWVGRAGVLQTTAIAAALLLSACGPTSAVATHVVVQPRPPRGPARWGVGALVTEYQSQIGLESISCATSLWCMALTDNGDSYIYRHGSWRRGPSISGSADALSISSLSISCPSVSFCMVVTSDGEAFPYARGKWGLGVQVDSYVGGDSLDAVSCPAPRYCLAVDDSPSGNVFLFERGHWRLISRMASGPGLWTSLSATISCASRTFCMEADGNGYARTYVRGVWSRSIAVDATRANGGPGITNVSCPANQFCVATGGGTRSRIPTERGPRARSTSYLSSSRKAPVVLRAHLLLSSPVPRGSSAQRLMSMGTHSRTSTVTGRHRKSSRQALRIPSRRVWPHSRAPSPISASRSMSRGTRISTSRAKDVHGRRTRSATRG